MGIHAHLLRFCLRSACPVAVPDSDMLSPRLEVVTLDMPRESRVLVPWLVHEGRDALQAHSSIVKRAWQTHAKAHMNQQDNVTPQGYPNEFLRAGRKYHQTCNHRNL